MENFIPLLGAFVFGAALTGLLKKWNYSKSHEELQEASPEPEPQKTEDENLTKYSAQQLLLLNRIELGNGRNDEKEMPPSSDLLMISILEQLKGANLGKALKMSIKCGSDTQVIVDEYEILSFDIREFVKTHHEGKTTNSIIIIIEFERKDVVITLLANGNYSENTRYFRLSAISLLDTGLYHSYSSLIEVRFTDSNQDYWEAKYMIDEALAKKEAESQSDQTMATLSVLYPSLSYDIYWGKKYYQEAISSHQENCFIHQALFHLNRVNDALRKDIDNLNENGQNAFIEINLNIGYLLILSGELSSAYSYLELARRSNTILAEMLYVDCLCGQFHPFAEGTIKDILAKVLQQINNSENQVDLTDFNRFLNRRLVYVYMNSSRYSDAELILNRMLANREDDPQYINETLQKINEEKERANKDSETYPNAF